MAEFRLGRIKFVWQGEWAPSTSYVVDDVVSNAGKSWICVVNHTSSSLFVTDSDNIPARWHLVSDGLSWRGNWEVSTYYNVGDQVKYGGTVYVANVAHTSAATTELGLEADQAKWDIIATSFYWTGNWAVSTRYRINDFVVYGGTTYFCNTAHTSAATNELGLEDNQSYWTAFNNGIIYLGNWTDTVRYKVNDVVKYGSGSWICTEAHVSTTTFDDTKWSVFVEGLEFEDSWNSATIYQIGDVVTYGGYSYIAKRNNTDSNPSTGLNASLDWQLYTTGFNFNGDWNDTTNYRVGDVVRLGSYTYLAIADNQGQTPPNLAVWNQLNSGFKWTNVAETYNSISGTNVSGIGSASTFNITRNGTVYSAVVNAAGINYAVGDTILVSGSDVGGLSPINDVVLTVESILGVQLVDGSSYVGGTNLTIGGNNSTTSPLFLDVYLMSNAAFTANFVTGAQFRLEANSKTAVFEVSTIALLTATDVQVDLILVSGDQTVITTDLTNAGVTFTFLVEEPASIGPIVSVSAAGYAVTWTNGTSYVSGDVVLFGANSYVCVLAHQSSSLTRPDQDTTAAYWNLLAAGSESAVLTTPGDTYYFGSTGPTRLPIGTDGQLLRVKGGYPTWAYFGVINNVVYVAPTGVDDRDSGRGLTIDKPWRTVRYACAQIERGYLHTGAVELLKRNKQFLMKEITNWITYTYTVNVSGTVSGNQFVVDSTNSLTVNMPIQFSGTVGGVTANTKYFVKEIVDSSHFTISATQGGNVFGLSVETGTMKGTLSYDSTYCQRDVGLLVDALIFDLSHGGNESATSAAKAYYTTSGSAYINSNFGQQITQTVAAYNYLRALVADVIANQAPAINYQSANGLTTGVATQIIDPSLVADPEVVDLASALIGIVTDGISSGSVMAIPTASYSNTTISVKTGTYTEVLPIIIPNHTAVVGDELRSTTVVPNAPIDNLVNDKTKTISALKRIKSVLPNLIANNVVEVSTSNTAEQQFVFKSGESTNIVTANLDKMTSIIANGLTSVPASYTLPTPTGGSNNAFTAGFFNAARLIGANKAFLKAEVTAWINTQITGNISPFAGFTYNQVPCERDVGYIVDALVYDLTYGGNLATQIAARSYYSNGVLVEVGEKTQALALWTYVKSIVDDIATGVAITPSSGNTETQNTSGTAGSAGAATVAQTRIQEIYDTINTGTAPTTVSPDTTWVSASLTTTFTTIQNNKALIKTAATDWVNFVHPELIYDAATCARDVGYIVDALSYDMIFGSNFLSCWNAMSYHRALTSTGIVLAQQLQPTLGVIGLVGSAIKELVFGTPGSVGNPGVVQWVEQSSDTIYDIINNGLTAVPAERITDPSTLDSNFRNARTQIANNYAFIKADVSQYIINNYNSVWVALGATGQAACQRDVGYILDAIRYDLTYGGNTQSLIAGRAYWSGIARTINSTELTATNAAYTHLKSIIDDIAKKLTVTPQAGNSTPQVVSGTGDLVGTAATFAQSRVQEVIDWITNGTSPTSILPTLPTDNASTLAYQTMQARKVEVQNDALGYIQKFYQSMDYNETVCYRDVGYMVDAVMYDAIFKSNVASITVGRSYHRAISSAQVVLANQKDASLGLVKFLKYKLKGYAVGGAIAKASTVIDDIVGFIDGGAVPRFTWPSFTGIDAENYAAAKLIFDNKKFIQAETLKYINNNYPSVVYNRETCARDVGYIIDAVRYDMTYGGNVATRQAGISYYSQLTSALQIDSADKTATLAAYANLKSLLQDIANGGLSSYTPLQTNVNYVSGTAGDSASSTLVGNLIDGITTTINSGIASAPAETLPSTTWVASNLATQASALISAKAAITASVTTYIGENYPNLNYDSATCERDVGYIIDAVSYDMMLGSNYRSVKSGMAYYQAQANKVLSAQKRATLNAYRFLKDALKNVVASDSEAVASVSKNMSIILNIIDNGIGETPDLNGSLTYVNNLGNGYAVEILRANKEFLASESTAWIRSTFTGTVTSTASGTNLLTTSTAHNLSVGDPVIFPNNVIVTSATSCSSTDSSVTLLSTAGILVGSKVIFTGGTLGNLLANTTYYVVSILSPTKITVTTTYGDPAIDPGTAVQLVTATIGENLGGLDIGVQYYVLTAPTGTTLTLTNAQGSTTPVSVTDDNGAATLVYSFNEASCKRDMREYVDALVDDLQLPGNHKGLNAALLYNNAVEGSEASDMFWVSNASGLRNMTLSGLSGDLTELNDFGTRRPTAGAFVALNPGFGPMDSRVWVISRSHYSQNVTMFGAGCTGAKIDAALHRYGNKSMVKNDFTTIISDGIGVWCTGQDSLTELVSVFNYYGYSGYLAELGGRIRATNGNSSYGTYGVIAEGVDVHETPLYGTINNRYNQAQITNAQTDGVSNILRLEFSNAGSGYTNVSYTLSGAGYNAAAYGDEFRDAAVFETRIIDLNDDNGVGGSNYATQSNAAQTGDLVSVTIAATDTALTNAYNSMRIYLTAGTGAGQYANILTYNGGSKIAQLYKDSFATLTVTATAITNNLLTVASTATLYPGMPIYLTSDANGLSANTLYYVRTTGFTTTQFSVSTTGANGTAVTITTTGSVSLPLLAAGWDHAVPGTAIELALDLTTQYIIEPKINYTAPGYTASLINLGESTNWKEITYGDNKFVTVPYGSTSNARYTSNGTTWANAGALTETTAWTGITYAGGEGAVASVTIGGLGGQGAVLQAVLGVPNTTGAATQDQVASVKVIDGGAGYTTPPVIVFTPVSGGTGAVATCAVLNGAIVSVTVTIPGSGYTVAPTVTAATDRVTVATVTDWGKNYFSTPSVTVSDPFSGSAWSSGGTATLNAYYYYVNTGVKYWYRATVAGTFTTTGPVHTSGSASNGTATLTYVGTTAILTPTLENAGVKSLAITNSGKGYTTTPTVTILDTGARYVAMASNGVNCYTTSAGILAGAAWTAGTAITGSPIISSMTYGNGVFVAVGGTSSCASSTNGSTWTVRTVPTLGAGTYSSVAYGNGTFVAISTGNNATAVSSNGNSWIAGGNLPSSATWTSVAYGNGRFVAIASGSRSVAISLDKGISWSATTPGLPTSQNWSSISYGQGLFIAVNSNSAFLATSPDGINWKQQSRAGLTSNPTTVKFGNPAGNPMWLSIGGGISGALIKTGAQATGRVKVISGQVSEIRMIEPGSSYPKASVTGAVGSTTDTILTPDTTNLVDKQPIEFTGCTSAGLIENITYYVIGSSIVANTSFQVSADPANSTPINLTTASGLSGSYRAGPIAVITDPNKVKEVAVRVRLGDGALGNPSFSNRGTDMTTATAEVNGDGYSDLYQPSSFINVSGLYDIPEPGANVEFDSLPGVYFKLVTITNELGDLGNKTATFQINPALSVLQAPVHGDRITTRIKYSQVRLTGHDFLYIGTGGKEQTNYPNVDISTAIQANQTVYSAGGRVFFTSTDQDGNFNVGNLFGVQQATGTATLNASAFNLSGLNSLQLGSVELGIGSAIITQFSTDPFFTADSDNIVPTQRAIKAYITSQIGGGQSSLNVNTLTSGVVYIAGNSITTTTGEAINVTTKMNFTGGIDGAPVALGFFMQR